MVSIIKFGVISYISQKVLKVIGQKDMGDIVAFCGWIGISVEAYNMILGVYNAINNSEIVKLFNNIGNFIEKVVGWFQ